MKHFLRGFGLLSLFFLPFSLWAQLPPNQPEQDCFNALPVCQDIYFQPNSYEGRGEETDEINGAFSCMLLGERNSVWYIFKIETGGQLCFTISPVDSTDDYDWALYNLTFASCAQIATNPALEVACNWSYNAGCAGETGPNGRTDCPGQFEPCITVNAGDTYVLNVSNFTSSNAGYTLDFTQSSAVLFDDIPPDVTGISSFCHGVSVEFSENILCSSVDPTDFAFSGPDGPYTISAVRSQNCDNGGGFDRTFDLVVDPPIQQAGTYTLSLVGFISDFCGNGANPYTNGIFMPLPPTAAINDLSPQCLDGNLFGFGYTGASTVQLYRWDFGDGTQSVQPSPIHTYETADTFDVQQIIIDVNNCPDTATTTIIVQDKPLADFFVPPAVCQSDSLPIFNFTTAPNATLNQLTWRMSDGTVSNDFEFSHAFQYPGTFQVFLEAFNDLGCRDTVSRFVQVYPQADISFIPEDNVCAGEIATLVNTSTIEPLFGDQIVDWSWDMGDGTTYGPEVNVSHQYDSGGHWPVTLYVETNKGCLDSAVMDQIIYQPPPPDIIADPVCLGDIAYLQAYPEPGGMTRWYQLETDTVPFYQGPNYNTPPVVYEQIYWVEVLSEQGCVSQRVPLSANYHPSANGFIVVSDSVVEFPNPVVQFNLAGATDSLAYTWNFGDETYSYDATPAHEYAYPNIYTVRLGIRDPYGCIYEFEEQVEVKNLTGFHIPSAFSPNADGWNDEWYLSHRLIQNFRVVIYNRFGREVFTSDNPDFRWDGTGKDAQPAPQGVYVYKVEAVDNLGNPVAEAGTLTLIR
ncbi:MAG: PKD domain-containing protein [Bacteroidota bacterium]